MWNERRAREALLDTIADVRMDGTMASISGTDAPNILITKSLQQYIEQTQDISVLMEERTYFDDLSHHFELDAKTEKERRGDSYKGTIIEHLLVLQLVQFYEMVDEAKKTPDKAQQLSDSLNCVATWIQDLQDGYCTRHLEIAVELDVLLAHREDLLKEESYGKKVLDKYKASIYEERFGVKTHLPAKMIIDSLTSKAKWLNGKEDIDE